MKYFFVGMHNKPKLMPLCSSTKTGKIVDEIISNLKHKCVKTNLCEVEYQPIESAEIYDAAVEWHEKYNLGKDDVIVLLGKWVQENFQRRYFTIIDLPHPASVFKDREGFIKRCVEKIKIK